MEEGKVLDLDGKMWPDASDTDASSHYKVPLIFSVQEQYLLLLCINLKCCVKCAIRKPKFLLINASHFFILQVPFSRIVYIEKTDFRLKDSKDYYGLAPGKSVMLRYPLFFLRKFI